jgi:PKD repeat protein
MSPLKPGRAIKKGFICLVAVCLVLGAFAIRPARADSILFTEDFENGFASWTLDGLWNPELPSDSCGSQQAPFPNPATAAYYGNDQACNYDTGEANEGALTLNDPITLPEDGPGARALLVFWSFSETEQARGRDIRQVEVSDDGGSTWYELARETTFNQGDWDNRHVSLDAYLGKSILLRFRFTTVNGAANGYYGWLVDDIRILVNHPPVAADDEFAADEDNSLSVAAPGVLANDSDPDPQEELFAWPYNGASELGASVSMRTDGGFVYDPAPIPGVQGLDTGETLVDSFNYWLVDHMGGEDRATVRMAVNGANDAPNAIDDATTTAEDTPIQIDVLANDQDIDGEPLMITAVEQPGHGQVEILPGGDTLIYTPAENYSGPDSFQYTASDEAESSSAGVTLEINPVDDAPVLAAIGLQQTDEGVPLVFQASAEDVDDAPGSATFSLGSGAPEGVSLGADGSFAWTPTESQGPGEYEVTIQASDGDSTVLSDEETFTIQVGEVNQSPVLASIGARSVDQGSLLTFAVSATDADLPANGLTYSLDPGAPGGTSITAQGVFSWTPGYDQAAGNYSMTIRVSDDGSPARNDSETFVVTVNQTARPLAVDAGADQAAPEGTPLSFQATVIDPTLQAANASILWDFGDGTTGSGSLTTTHTYLDNGNYTVTLTVVADNGSQGTDSLAVHVANALPVVNAGLDRLCVNEVLVDFTGSFSDPGSQDSHTILWDFGDGMTSAGSLETSHAFARAGIFTVTLEVTDDDGGVNRDSLEVDVRPIVREIHMPLVAKTGRPDLTASLSLFPAQSEFTAGERVEIRVQVTNLGFTAVSGFWVDLAINPAQVPSASTGTWDQLCTLSPCYGIAWHVEQPLLPGESITLTSTPDSYAAAQTIWPGWFAPGTSDLYVFVDSWEPGSTSGAIQELDEGNNLAELHGILVE